MFSLIPYHLCDCKLCVFVCCMRLYKVRDSLLYMVRSCTYVSKCFKSNIVVDIVRVM